MPILLLLCCSIFTFFVLYAPQPLLMVFATQFGVSVASSGSLMSITMLPLAIAPIFYGLLFAHHNALHILKYAMLMLAATCIIFVYVPNFELLLLTRFLQGLILPAILTALTSYIGQQYQGKALHKNMTRYIASTIIGGYFGRMLAANFASFYSWESFYYVIATALTVLAITINVHLFEKNTHPISSPREYLKPLKEPTLLRLYLAVFCMFFCFSALLNYLPFILSTQFSIIDSRLIGWIYSGYFVGAILSLTTPLLKRHLYNNWLFLTVIFSVYSGSIIVLDTTSISIFVSAFTLFCACMFMIHATAAPLANVLSTAPVSVTNGAYVSFYYTGGALGSYFPGLVIEHLGYHAFIINLFVLCLCGLLLIHKNYKQGISTTLG
ncbi:MFS transporter [Pseudoalteromonas aurantia]|uniref:Major facilitator superfamily (MFS) profile domain-containing protein n=1 Tax=Pseudoalteromonas aurantia 208 TaxID=1314867 RepID=A0ABR9EF13_9GAMM|nr:MFS transporter [Pseudoalteromonas aurantia]MBE0369580.1 hypothetical protein [Pseudoalteromonas aurantia 208]